MANNYGTSYNETLMQTNQYDVLGDAVRLGCSGVDRRGCWEKKRHSPFGETEHDVTLWWPIILVCGNIFY